MQEDFFDLRVFIIGILRKWRVIASMTVLIGVLGCVLGLVIHGNIAMYSLAGLAGGFAFGIVAIFFVDVMSTKIADINEYKKLMRVDLGLTLPVGKHRRNFAFVDNRIDRFDGSTIPRMTADEAINKLCADIAMKLREKGNGYKLCITGTVPLETLVELHSTMSKILSQSGIECALGGSLLNCADTVNLLKECDGILLVGKQGHTTRPEAQTEMAMIKSFGLDIVALAWVE